jgi:Bifunctional DNA primase/polymerase, N-terminal/Primase C terminal 2 (PriCT-2)/AAA domain
MIDKVTKARLEAMNRANAAKTWFAMGYTPMPVLPGQKATRLAHKPWLEKLTERYVDVHWSSFPFDEIALHCGKGLVVLDADSSESLEAMLALEQKHGLVPAMVVKTKKGVHHYFRQSPELRVTAAGHSTANHPERIDVRCGNGYIITAPSTDKVLATAHLVPFAELTSLTQEFVDDLMVHNGDRILTERPTHETVYDGDEFGGPVEVSVKVARMKAMLEHIDPEQGYNAWFKVLAAIHHETDGSEEGLALADDWSSTGASYEGFKSIEKKWSSLDAGSKKPATMRTIAAMVKDSGEDWRALCSAADDPFVECTTPVVSIPALVRASAPAPADTSRVSLKQFSLLGNLDAVRQYAVEATPLLGALALKGQFTVLYANSNVGKTLITLHLVKEAIAANRIAADDVIYVNVDDGSDGILVKGEIAEQLGFHELAIGYQDFTLEKFNTAVNTMIATRDASGTLLILDTIKKFTDVTNKTESSAFAELMRKFTAVGGSVVALAHTNKNRNTLGKVVQGGTSDIPQDADCTYTIDAKDQGSERIVTFENTKARGPVPRVVQYAYSLKEKNYSKLLSTVREITVDELTFDFEVVPDENPEDRIIRAFKEAICSGVTGKTELINSVRALTGFSRAKLATAHDRYCGSDPQKHHWDFKLVGRGLHEYFLIEKPEMEIEEVI